MPSTTMSTLINFSAIVAGVLFLLIPSTTATCYWQNSTLAPDSPYSIAPDDTPCFPSQQNSPCCGTGWSCLSDGVCFIQQGSQDYYYRGTCTDKTWDSQQCPGWCFAQNSNTSIPLTKCTKSNGEDWYCCPGDADCSCDTGKDAIKLGASQPVTVTVIGSTTWPGYISTSTPVGAGNIAGAQSSTTTTQTSSTATANAGGVKTTSASTTAPSTTSINNISKTNTTSLAVGVGVGVGVAVLLVGAIAAFLFQRSRKRRAATAGYSQQSIDPHTGLGSNTQAQPLMQSQHEGYYANSLINEKDGRPAWTTQELPASGVVGRAEIDGSVPARPRPDQRVELP